LPLFLFKFKQFYLLLKNFYFFIVENFHLN